MIKHIVMFKMKGETLAEKNTNIRVMKEFLENLPSKITEIKDYEVGINISQASSAMDMVLYSTFENNENLNTYRDHPEHKKILDFLHDICEGVKVVDYKI